MDYKKKYLKYKLKYLNAKKTLRGGSVDSIEDYLKNTWDSWTMSNEQLAEKVQNAAAVEAHRAEIEAMPDGPEKEAALAAMSDKDKKAAELFQLIGETKKDENICELHAFLKANEQQFALIGPDSGTLNSERKQVLLNLIEKWNVSRRGECVAAELAKKGVDVNNKYKKEFKRFLWKEEKNKL